MDKENNPIIQIDKRKFKRFQVPGGTFALLQPGSTGLCQVIDISKTGLAFRYTSGLKKIEETHSLDLLLGEGGFYFYLGNLPFEVISDFQWGFETINDSPLGFFTLRRRGVKFRDFTKSQKSQLDYFLNNYALEMESDLVREAKEIDPLKNALFSQINSLRSDRT